MFVYLIFELVMGISFSYYSYTQLWLKILLSEIMCVMLISIGYYWKKKFGRKSKHMIKKLMRAS